MYKNLGEILTFGKTYSTSRAMEMQSNLYHIHYGDIHLHKFSRVDEYTKLHSIGLEGNFECIKENDIIFADASEDLKDLGNSCVVINISNKKIIAGLHTYKATINNVSRYNSQYIQLFTQTQNYKKEIYRLGTGISVYGISKTNLSKIKVPIYDIGIQNKFVELFTSMDELIQEYEELRDEYVNFKKYYLNTLYSKMEQSNLINDLFLIQSTGLDKILYESEHIIKMINYMDVYNGTINFENLSITSGSNDKIRKNLVQNKDILITPTSETPNDIFNSVVIEGINGQEIVYSYHIMKLTQLEELNPFFYKYYFDTSFFRNNVAKYATGSTRFTLSKYDIGKLSVPHVPLKTQTQIADFLSSIDIFKRNT